MTEHKDEPDKKEEKVVESIEIADTPLAPEEKPLELKKTKPSGFKAFLRTKKGKVVAVIVGLIIVLGVLFAIPATRFAIAGQFIKKDVHITIVDKITSKPVSKATVTIADKTVTTEHNGEATIKAVPVGDYTIKVVKKYYKDSDLSYQVPLFSNPTDAKLDLEATGRQVTVVVTNKITQKPIEKATVTVKDTSATTDSKGMTTIVLPADQKTLKAAITAEGYNQSDAMITVVESADANKVTLTPAGTIFYLSKQTGKINVMKSNLDGANAQTVVEGTGNEVDSSTVLLAARDWKYMTLSAKRDTAKKAQIYLVDGTTGKLSNIDEGDADFQLVGWSGHRFIYLVNRYKQAWEDKRQTLKSFDAETGKITVLDETSGFGTNFNTSQSEGINTPYITEDKIVYAKPWSFGQFAPRDKASVIMAVKPDGSQKQRVKEFTTTSYVQMDAKLYEPQSIYFRVATEAKVDYYEYEDGALKGVSNTDDKFYNKFYPTYLISPTGKKTFWYEARDGKNVLFVGDKDGKNTTELASQSDFIAYGWYSDLYVLLSKNESELYIAAADKLFTDGYTPLKVTNYHKPAVKYPGYGYGYGGQ